MWAQVVAPPGRPEAQGQPVAAAIELRAVYDEHYPFVWRLVQRFGVADAAVDDAVQDVFIVVSRRLTEFEGRSSMRTWLYAITRRVVMHYHRSAQRLERRKDALAREVKEGSDGGYERSDSARTLHELLGRIDEGRREVFVLSELEGLTAPEIGEMLGLKVPTVYSRLRTARIELEKLAGELAGEVAREVGKEQDHD